MDTQNDICRQCEHSGHVTESDCDECALTITSARLDPAPISKTRVAIIPKSELAALRSQLAAAVAALESIANDTGYKMSQALNETHLWEMTAKRRQQMARQALAEIRGDDGSN